MTQPTENAKVASEPCKDCQKTLSRRQFLNKMSIAVGGLGALLAGVPVIGFVLGPLLNKPPGVWRPVGAVDQFKVGSTVEVAFEDNSPEAWAGVTAKTAAWLRRDDAQTFIAYAINCTHLGCPVRWEAGADLFMCPCHGGVYYKDGSVAAGPPPKPLVQYPIRINNGKVEIQTSPIPIT